VPVVDAGDVVEVRMREERRSIASEKVGVSLWLKVQKGRCCWRNLQKPHKEVESDEGAQANHSQLDPF
jgi:hypothetical protein